MPIDSGGRPRLHGCSWPFLVDSASFKSKYLPVITSILDGAHKGHVRALAMSKDKKGRTALKIAAPEARREIQRRLFYLGRYDLELPAVHKSKTCVVHFAKDCLDDSRPVAVKIMMNEDEFGREIKCRSGADTGTVVIRVLRWHAPPGKVQKFSRRARGQWHALVGFA